MPEKSSSLEDATLVAGLPSTVNQTVAPTSTSLRAKHTAKLGHWLMGLWAIAGALMTGNQTSLSQLLERQAQVWFFEFRGPLTPPADIVIVGLDEDSSVQGSQVYPTDPQKYADLEPLETAPPKRSAYAIAVDRLMQAGAKTVAIDVVLDGLSASPKADQQLSQVLAKYPKRVTLAAQYEDVIDNAGQRTQVITPHAIFEAAPLSIGHINYAPAPNGKLHTLGREYPLMVAKTYPPDIAADFLQTSAQIPSFAEAALQSAQIAYAPPQGTDIFYYGPKNTFPQVPLWHILDQTNWQKHLKDGTFKGKIVLIGPTAAAYRDFHNAPFAGTFRYPNPMSGIEINANAIATLMENRAIAMAIAPPWGQAAYVLTVCLGAGWLQSRARQSHQQLLITAGILLGIATLGYGIFTYRYLSLPTAIPLGAIALSGVCYFLTQTASDYLRRMQLRQTLAQYANSPIVQEIISQQEDLQDILILRQQAVFGKTLKGRYCILKVLGSGGFSETFIAEDTHRPGHPTCVVKHLRLTSDNPKLLQLARTMFQREATILEKLGKHDRIPQLLAYFEEENEFYLVQEFIPGHPLSTELRIGMPFPENRVIVLLRDLLEIIAFVHSQNVIHRDIKPSNIIRRKSDGKLVLIDFGAVKEIPILVEQTQQLSSATVGIGTRGFMPDEQYAGNPRFSSDLYAIGMTGVQALTGLPPSHLKTDDRTGDLLWRDRAQVSQALAEVVTKMIRRDFSQRYESAQEVLEALEMVASASIATESSPNVGDFWLSDQELKALDTFYESDGFLEATTQLWIPANPQTNQPTDLPFNDLSTNDAEANKLPIDPFPTDETKP